MNGLTVEQAVEKIQPWLLFEGGHSLNMEELLNGYVQQVADLGVHVDRIFVAGMPLHPKASAYTWRWQKGRAFHEYAMPKDVYERRTRFWHPSEPLNQIVDHDVPIVRFRPSQNTQLPPDCQWLREENYEDFIALPIHYRDKIMGGMTWASRQPFTDEQIRFLKLTQPAMATVIRLHTNENIMKTLTESLEEQVKERTKDLEHANNNLATANRRIKDQVATQLKHFAMMSHEIRTPLNCIVAMSSLLLDTAENDNTLNHVQKDSVRMISRSGEHLVEVVNDVLDYSRLESGNVDVLNEPSSLREIVDTVEQVMEVNCLERGQTLDASNVDFANLPKVINIDKVRLQQVMFNLIGNAIKFSNDGGRIEFKVAVNDGRVQFQVKDYGRGIPKSHLDSIFEPFHQGPKETHSTHGGTGLGLAISQKLVLAMGGQLTGASELGKWTEFVVSFPLSTNGTGVKCEGPGSVTTSPRRKQPSFKLNAESLNKNRRTEMRVLAADDNVVNQKIVRQVLGRLGVTSVDIVSNGEEAVSMELKNEYDLVLMDVQMPVMDGFEAATCIIERNRPHLQPPPRLVFLTAHALNCFRQEALQKFGMEVEYIAKPFSLQKIRELVEEVQLTKTKRSAST